MNFGIEIFVLFSLILCLEALTVTNPPYGQLKVSGKYVTKMDGTPVQLRGMSLYCSDDPYLGSKFWNAETMQQLKCAWNSNAVRIPLIIDGEGYSKNPAVEYPKVVTAIEAAISTGIYIIVDWHAFSDRLDIAVPFFKNISKLYGQYPHVLYETYNEPSWADSWTNLTAYHTAIINAIRANDPDNIIIVGTPRADVDVNVSASSPLKFSNIAYTLHYYTNLPTSNLVSAQGAINLGLPIFVTEYGACSADGNGYVNVNVSKTLYSFLDQNKISYLAWTLSTRLSTTPSDQGCFFALKAGASVSQVGNSSYWSDYGAYVNQKLRATNNGIVC